MGPLKRFTNVLLMALLARQLPETIIYAYHNPKTCYIGPIIIRYFGHMEIEIDYETAHIV